MATKVFISWSGDLSNQLAEALRQWLPGVLQFVKPYFTPSDIEKGTKWGSEILGELDSSNIGIICLTKDNLSKPWILFEAGALSKNFERSRVCTLLFGVESTDLKGPLTIFQSTKFEKKDFKKLVKSINSAGGDSKLEDSVFDQVFEMWWSKLEDNVNKIIGGFHESDVSENRSERDILEEVLELSRLNSRRTMRDQDIHPQAIRDLIKYVTEIMFAVDIGDLKRIQHLSERLDEPIRYICRRSKNAELYQEYKMLKKRRDLEIHFDENEENS